MQVQPFGSIESVLTGSGFAPQKELRNCENAELRKCIYIQIPQFRISAIPQFRNSIRL